MGVYEVKFFNKTNSLGAMGKKPSSDFIFQAIDLIFWNFTLFTLAQLFIFMIFLIWKILFNTLLKFCSGEGHRSIGKSTTPHVENSMYLNIIIDFENHDTGRANRTAPPLQTWAAQSGRTT